MNQDIPMPQIAKKHVLRRFCKAGTLETSYHGHDEENDCRCYHLQWALQQAKTVAMTK
jgi:hypothetical protein